MADHLITGGSGFVGSHIAEYLLSRGESVVVYDITPPDITNTNLASRVEYVEGDVRNQDYLETVMNGIEYVHHNVALVPLTKAGETFRDVNVTGTRNVMEAALKSGVEGVTHVSSSAVYDLSEMPVTEETPLEPIGRYGRSKLKADRVTLQYAEKGLPVNIIRPRTVLDQRRAGIYQILFDWIDRNKRVYMLGDGDNQFQLVSGRDLADASFLTATTDITGEVFNIGNERYNTLREDLRHLIKYAGSDSSLTCVPAQPASITLEILDRLRLSPLAPWHYKTVHRDYYFNISKAKTELGWEPTDSNFEMFQRAYDWYDSHQNAIEQKSSSITGSAHQTAPRQKILKVLRKLS